MRIRSMNHGKIRFPHSVTGKVEELNYLDEAELPEADAAKLIKAFPGLVSEVKAKSFEAKAEVAEVAGEAKEDPKAGKKAK